LKGYTNCTQVYCNIPLSFKVICFYFHIDWYFKEHELISAFFLFMWPCIVTNFFVTKPTRCINFTNLVCHETTCFRQFLCPSSGVYSLCTQQWYMSYRFVDSFRAGAYAYVSASSSVHHQEFIHCTLSSGICHTGF
jgi:hypothetical protein